MQEGEKEEELVQISRDELKELAEAAGITVKTTTEVIKEERMARREAELEAARGPNAFTPLIEALQPVFELPPLLQYPIILGLLGLLSFPFSLIFGSGSLGDSMGVPSERGAPPAKEAAAPKAIKAPTAQDPSNNIAPKELQINRKSCDVFPYSLTPTCTVCPFAALSFVLSRACYARVSACVSLCAFFVFVSALGGTAPHSQCPSPCSGPRRGQQRNPEKSGQVHKHRLEGQGRAQ